MKVASKIGISAGSYSRNVTAGNIGKCTIMTRIILIAAKTAIVANFFVEKNEFF